ncbi:endonuclease-reverse transcriptase [Plakobranchus ocellatus]|uniref:Endonuclease-reverse transcriptase n=1 Tax=Plakobranchus ocellatus TaxID=259542 RepID=A0AAV4A3P7_9GAST|nr:endonuclease-reverse transcriptase [Plakobranchus ocellatus]
MTMMMYRVVFEWDVMSGLIPMALGVCFIQGDQLNIPSWFIQSVSSSTQYLASSSSAPEADFDSHCNGKKHKANERVRGEQKAAKCSVLVRGARGCKNLEEFLATYFCHFGLLAKISALGPAKNGVIRVQYMEEESVRRVLSLGPTHEHDGIKFQISKFIYKPQMGDAMRLSQKEETSKQKVARTNLHANICELLGKTKSVEEGLQSVTENFQLSPQDFKDRAAIVRKLAEVFASHNPDLQKTLLLQVQILRLAPDLMEGLKARDYLVEHWLYTKIFIQQSRIVV